VASAATPAGVVVIVNAARPQTSFSRSFVAAVFLKKTTVWDDGATVRPVDLRPDAAVRAAFSDEILQRPVEAVRIYWEQRIFSGRDVPPLELDSEEAVVRYVATHPEAIGYVSSSTRLVGVKAVGIR
jgi:ABC-type phosphate transport system substrate-binding protein